MEISKNFSQVNIDDIKSVQLGAGVLLSDFDVDNPTFVAENVICVTTGGINPVCAPEYYDFAEDVDNAKPTKETKRIRGWNATISFTTLTTSLAAIKLALGAADISGKVLSLRQRLQYAKDFKDIWWVGKRADDELIAIRLIRSLSDSGFSLQTNKRGKGQISVTLKGHSSFAEKDKIPMEIYVLAESDTPVTPDEPTTSLYLYGTPSETGNIGLRNGDNVTYYSGAVLPALPKRDVAAYPYACITSRYATYFGVLQTRYTYIVFDREVKINENGNFEPYGEYKAIYCVYAKATYGTEWSKDTEINSGRLNDDDGILWSNFEVLDKDTGNTTAATAPDPIPVGEIVDTINDIPIYEVI